MKKKLFIFSLLLAFLCYNAFPVAANSADKSACCNMENAAMSKAKDEIPNCCHNQKDKSSKNQHCPKDCCPMVAISHMMLLSSSPQLPTQLAISEKVTNPTYKSLHKQLFLSSIWQPPRTI